MWPTDPLDADALQTALAAQRIGHRLLVLPEVTSTNDVLAQMAAEADEGLVVIAERQTAGRGQYGRQWESASGLGLWLSILLRPDIHVSESSRLTDLLAQAIAAAIEQQTGLKAAIKPPNDVYLGPRKVAGVLVEMRVEASGRYAAIAGLGLNVNQALTDFSPELRATATSLALAAGQQVDRAAFAIALLREIDRAYRAFRAT